MKSIVKLKQHLITEARTDRMLQAHQDLDRPLPGIVPVLGYTHMAVHDEFFGDSLGVEYRVTIEERARGIPLLGDHMARITGVAVGVGQNLFALTNGSGNAACSRVYGWRHSVADTASAVWGAFFSTLSPRSTRPSATSSISARI